MKNGALHYNTRRYVNSAIHKQESGLKKYIYNYVNFIKKFVRPGSKVLDVACGPGLSSHLLSKNYKVTGIDMSKGMVAYARKKFKDVDFRVDDAHGLSFPDESFDAVVACTFIEHINDVGAVLDEMLRVTKRNGHVIIVSPNWFSPLRPIRGIISPKGYEAMGKNRLRITIWLFKSIYYTFQKLINPKFVFQNPDIENEELVGNDVDMVYIASQYDLGRYFRKKGCKVLKLSADTFRFSSIPPIAPWLGVVAKKS